MRSPFVHHSYTPLRHAPLVRRGTGDGVPMCACLVKDNCRGDTVP